jgi:excisionase family DNA binding protein
MTTISDATNTSHQSPLLLSVLDACQRLGVGKWTLYQLMHQGLLPSVKIRSRRFVAGADLDELVERLRSEAGVRHGL